MEAWAKDTEGIDAAYEEVPFPKLHDKYMAELISGDPSFTVLHTMDSWTEEMASKGLLLVLDDLITSDLRDSLIPGSLDKLTYDGRVYGIPLYFWIVAFYHNTEILGEAGVTVPITWAEVRTTAKQITDKTDAYGFCTSLGGRMSMNLLGVILRSEGGEVWDDGPTFNTEAGVASLQLILDMFSDGSIHPSSLEATNQTNSIEMFIQGECGLYMGPPPTLVQAENPDMSKVVGKVGVTLMPGGSVHKTATTHQTGGRAISALASEGEIAATWKYIEHIMQTDQLVDMALALGRIPAGRAALNDPRVQAEYPLAAIVPEQLAGGPSGMIIVDENAAKMETALGRHLTSAFVDNVPAAEALAAAEAEMNASLED
jgi:multiple sugar transport system substrate-binding protein